MCVCCVSRVAQFSDPILWTFVQTDIASDHVLPKLKKAQWNVWCRNYEATATPLLSSPPYLASEISIVSRTCCLLFLRTHPPQVLRSAMMWKF